MHWFHNWRHLLYVKFSIFLIHVCATWLSYKTICRSVCVCTCTCCCGGEHAFSSCAIESDIKCGQIHSSNHNCSSGSGALGGGLDWNYWKSSLHIFPHSLWGCHCGCKLLSPPWCVAAEGSRGSKQLERVNCKLDTVALSLQWLCVNNQH